MSALFDDLPAAPPRPDLPPLRGSEKQIRWAEQIRTKKLAECERAITERRRLLAIWEQKGRAGNAELAEKAAALREGLRFIVDVLAKWEREDRSWVWIDSREMDAGQLLAHRG